MEFGKYGHNARLVNESSQYWNDPGKLSIKTKHQIIMFLLTSHGSDSYFEHWLTSKAKEELKYDRGFKPSLKYLCFSGADYIFHLWEDGYVPKKDYTVNKYHTTTCKPTDLYDFNDGVYIIQICTNFESHRFVLYIRKGRGKSQSDQAGVSMSDDLLTLYNSYGGCFGFFIKTWNRLDWIDLFVDYVDATVDQNEIYNVLFDFPKEFVQDITDRGKKHVLERMKYAKLKHSAHAD